ncbi:hypothetical protein ACH5RR_026280 [Cinchona calisaya]|uniref:Uncharacterized protein n=1 Tax=Cinchona calisaya TaxID=153742 RepID=A0ABD2Z378_9GENT
MVDARLQHEEVNFVLPSANTDASNLMETSISASGIKFKGIKRKSKTKSGKRLRSALEKATKRKRPTNKTSSSNVATLTLLELHNQQPIEDAIDIASNNSTVLFPRLYHGQASSIELSLNESVQFHGVSFTQPDTFTKAQQLHVFGGSIVNNLDNECGNIALATRRIAMARVVVVFLAPVTYFTSYNWSKDINDGN